MAKNTQHAARNTSNVANATRGNTAVINHMESNMQAQKVRKGQGVYTVVHNTASHSVIKQLNKCSHVCPETFGIRDGITSSWRLSERLYITNSDNGLYVAVSPVGAHPEGEWERILGGHHDTHKSMEPRRVVNLFRWRADELNASLLMGEALHDVKHPFQDLIEEVINEYRSWNESNVLEKSKTYRPGF